MWLRSCGEICHVEKCFHMTDISTWEMKNVETICFYALILHNHISLSQLTMYCYNLRCFVAKSVLLRFTRFCVEKNWTRNCACGENKTNIRYVTMLMEGNNFWYVSGQVPLPDNVDDSFVSFFGSGFPNHSSKSHVSWGIFCMWRLYTIPP